MGLYCWHLYPKATSSILHSSRYCWFGSWLTHTYSAHCGPPISRVTGIRGCPPHWRDRCTSSGAPQLRSWSVLLHWIRYFCTGSGVSRCLSWRGGESPGHSSRPTCLERENLVLLPHLFYSRYYDGGWSKSRQSLSRIVKADMHRENSEDFVIGYNRQIHCVVIDHVTAWTESSGLRGSRIEIKTMDGGQKRVGSNSAFI